MLLKKLGAIAATGAILLAVAAPAFADVNVTNHGFVSVDSATVSDSGSNVVSANEDGSVDGATIGTGVSVATSTVGSEVNNNTVTVSDSTGGNGPDVNVSNCGGVEVEAVTGANTGNNTIIAGEDGSVSEAGVTTGSSTAASNVQSLVNVNSVSVTTSGESID